MVLTSARVVEVLEKKDLHCNSKDIVPNLSCRENSCLQIRQEEDCTELKKPQLLEVRVSFAMYIM